MAALPANEIQYRSANDWTNYQSYHDAKKNVWKGKQDAVDRSNALIDKLMGDSIELESRRWRHDVAGFLPCVPSFLAGAPESMRRQEESRSDTTPIRVYASVAASAGISAEQMEARGVAILALCRKLGAHRPVELHLFAELDGTGNVKKNDVESGCAIPVIRMETSPLDLTTASYVMTDAGFFRQCIFEWGHDGRGFEGGWAWNLYPTDSKMLPTLREALKAEPQDLVITGALYSDPLVEDPVKWVNEQVNRYTAQLE